MRVIVGLGNPGREYAHTPHNLGFAVIERLVEQARLRRRQRAFRSHLWRGRLGGEKVGRAQPQTSTNWRGPAVDELLRAEGLESADLIVVADDVALPWGQLRLRQRG